MNAVLFVIALLVVGAPFYIPLLFAVFWRGINIGARMGFVLAVTVPIIVSAMRAPEPVSYDVPVTESFSRSKWWFEAAGASFLATIIFPIVGSWVFTLCSRRSSANQPVEATADPPSS